MGTSARPSSATVQTRQERGARSDSSRRASRTRSLPVYLVALVALLSVVLAALPTMAFAAGVTFSGESPANNARISVPGALTIQVNVADTVAMTAGSQKVYVDGKLVVARQTYLTFTSGSGNKAGNVLAYASVVGDGPHTIMVTVKDSSGATFTDSWGFSIGIPPTLGSPTPVDGATVPSLSPIIEIPAADNIAVMGASATINGVSAPAIYAAGKVSVSSGTLINDAVTVVSVTVTDGGGLTATKTWSFTVQKYPEIAADIADCTGCHTGFESDNDMGPECSNCHGGYDAPHQGPASSYHAPAVLDASCSPCHVTSLASEHGRYPAITCLTCHASADAAVKTAITGSTSSCTACHGATPSHTNADAPHAAAVAKCETSGCHTGSLASLHTTSKCATCHTATGVKDCATVGCHDTKLDSSGNVLVHSFTSAGHTSTSTSIAGQRYPGTDAAAQASNGTFLNPVFSWTSTCTDCHSMALDTQHANPTAADSCATCHKTDNTGAGDALKGGKWNKSCLAAGCHPADPNGGVPVAHLVNGQMDYSHTVATSLTTLPGGCSAPAGSGSYSGTDYQRTACHYSDIIQEHNRKIESGPSGTVVQTIAVTCAQCHASAQFKALNGKWDGSCDACHDGTVLKNHSIVGTAEYTRVHGLHQAPAYYSTGTNSTQGTLISGVNTMDAHGPLRTASVAAHPSAYKPIGCAQAFCHQNAYMKPGSGFYGATNCTQCHAANVAPANSPSGTMSVNNGAVSSASTAVTVNSNVVANGGATLVSMAVDPGTGVFGTAVPYSASYGITIPSSAGIKIIRVKYTDSAVRTSTYTTWISKVNGPSTITASVSGGNGAISPSGAVSVAQAANETFTFTPSAGYHVDTLMVDGTPVATPGSSYAFSNVTAAHTIVVTFAPTTFASSGVGADSYSNPGGLPAGTNDWVGYQTGLTLAMSQALPANSQLTFNTKYDIEDGFDFGYVQVSTDGGATWTNIAGTGTTNTEASGLVNYVANLGNGITGTQSTWAPATFDLSAYAGQTVKIRFDYRCDAGYYGNGGVSGGIGWNVDDVAVGPTGAPIFTDDFSTMKPDWSTYTNTLGHVWGF